MTYIEEDNDEEVPFVIGAGLGRTGTHSLRAALRRLLGHSKVFHMKDLFHGIAPSKPWFDLARQERAAGQRLPELALQTAKAVLDQKYTAVTDYPTCLLYQEFLQLHPKAKVILSVRRHSSTWKRSVEDTIMNVVRPLFDPPFSWIPFFHNFSHTLYPWLWERTGGIAPLGSMDFSNQTRVKASDYDLESGYIQWIEKVQATVPAQQLLIHQPSDGYSPLCEFLSISPEKCPSEPYPHIGDTRALQAIARAFEGATWAFWPLLSIVVFLMVWIGFGGRRNKDKSRRLKKNSRDNGMQQKKIQ